MGVARSLGQGGGVKRGVRGKKEEEEEEEEEGEEEEEEGRVIQWTVSPLKSDTRTRPIESYTHTHTHTHRRYTPYTPRNNPRFKPVNHHLSTEHDSSSIKSNIFNKVLVSELRIYRKQRR